MLHDKNFVVYAYVRRDGTPYYVGKGRPERPYRNGGRPCRTPPKERIKILHKNLDEFTALSIESALIISYGRKLTDGQDGLLCNISHGWDGISGNVFSGSSRKKLKESKSIRLTWYHHDYGVIKNLSATELIEKYQNLSLSQACLWRVVKGKSLMHKGWMTYKRFCKETEKRKKYLNGLSKTPGKLSLKDHKNKRKNWYHEQHGKFINKTATELVTLFPQMDLKKGSLYRVASGKSKFHKGWYILDDKEDLPKFLNFDKKIKANWFHPLYGKTFNVSVPELIRIFPDEKLKESHLYSVLNGSKKNYRGWTILVKMDSDADNINATGMTNNQSRFRSADGFIRQDWYHPEYGKFFKHSVKEIEQKHSMCKLRTNSLYEVSSGKRDSYKGWRLLKTSTL